MRLGIKLQYWKRHHQQPFTWKESQLNGYLNFLLYQLIASVGFTTGTSVGNLVCLAAARNAQYEKLGVHLDEVGLAGAPPLRVIVSEQAHVTVYKALGLLGFGKIRS